MELCSGLVEGGLTPSIGTIRRVLEAARGAIDVNVLLRPRPGDFLYTKDEVACMLYDIEAIKVLGGVHGVVLGALTAAGEVDVDITRTLIEAARPLSVTFHRAIDVARDPVAAVQACVDLGVDRILTSGAAATAAEGTETLRAMVKAAGGRIVVMAGAGVNADNAGALVAAAGVTEVHASARTTLTSAMAYRPARPVYMGGEKVNTWPDAEFTRRQCTKDTVGAVVAAIAAAIGSAPDGGPGMAGGGPVASEALD